ncbi:hypothetical protein [Craterilacuibacter sp. RT1T]|uniref:hypothetical protein n=1 Tax=Craterilacuibacter sp. RT1T TaxID=2942211 RepID=UPI0020C03661|nr:hypothetical protein [Craterilacuibacter sp. RT1T]MCL6262145.1 hypothetical protein [Craterilacuibacter sp. RT1T]
MQAAKDTAAYQDFRHALAFLGARAGAASGHAAISETRPPLETVTALQAKVLTPAQLDAISQVQSALAGIQSLGALVNTLIAQQGLPLQRPSIADTARLSGDIEGALFDHSLALAKLAAGGRTATPSTDRRIAA